MEVGQLEGKLSTSTCRPTGVTNQQKLESKTWPGWSERIELSVIEIESVRWRGTNVSTTTKGVSVQVRYNFLSISQPTWNLPGIKPLITQLPFKRFCGNVIQPGTSISELNRLCPSCSRLNNILFDKTPRCMNKKEHIL